MKPQIIKPNQMKKLVYLLLLFAGMVNAQIVNIPDANFKAKLISLGIDLNTDGNIQNSEALLVSYLDLYNSNISDLTGISSFTNLYNLICPNNSISNLNLTGLINLQGINCSNNQLTTLNLTGVTNLAALNCSNNLLTTLNGISNNVNYLKCNNNRLTSFNAANLNNLLELDLSNNKITSFNINTASNLGNLDINSNLLTSISIDNFPNLFTFDCTNNRLTSLTISNLSSLSYVYCKANPELTTVNVSNLSNLLTIDLTGVSSTGTGLGNSNRGNLMNLTLINLPSISNLNCSYNKLASLNLNNLTSLLTLDCSFNKITNLSLANLPSLTSLTCLVNKMQNLDVSNLQALGFLSCGSGQYVNGQVTNVLQNINITGLLNLKWFQCSESLITNLDLTGVPNLENLYFSGIQNAGTLSSLNVNGLIHLKSLSITNTALTVLDVSNLVDLEVLQCSSGHITSLSLNGLLQLRKLNYSSNYLTNISLTNLPLLERLDCYYNQLTTLEVNSLANLKELYCGYNQLTILNLTGLTSLVNLDFSSNNLGLANITGLSPNLVSLACGFNNLTSIDISGFPALEGLSCRNNLLTGLDLSNANNLKYLDCQSNQITTLNLNNLNNLTQLECSDNLLTTLNTSNLINLTALKCTNNQINNLNLINNLLLETFAYSNNPLPNFNVNDLVNLTVLSCYDTQTSMLNVSNLANLQVLYCDNNLLQSLDVSNCHKLQSLECTNNLLNTLFVKNGKNEIINFSNNPSLQYICSDTDQLYTVQNQLNALGMTATVSNSYCTFTPGGNHNTISGLTIFDKDNNGCDVTDEVNPFIRLDVNDGAATGSTVTNINGSYNFYTNAGNYNLTPNVENPTWFDFSPPTANFSFANNNNNISSQDFCIEAVGIHNDIEVVLIPIDFARPGFDATYKIVYKNKGNQMHSGNVSLLYNDAKIDFVNSIPSINIQNLNILTWNFTNLMPFENRSIDVKLNVNSPVETPAVNIGEILDFTAKVTPLTGDELPYDNIFDFNQIVVGSFDPNDITCLEGDTVDPTDIGDYLHYVINFENLGTFYAENIVVRDAIDTTKYDISTLQVMNTSHPSYTRITSNVVEFIFENIDLAAAQGNPPVGGHGNVLFKIKSKETLSAGDSVNKSAAIFFDYNAPVLTNNATTTFISLSNAIFEVDKSITIYPNPTSSKINISSDFDIKSIELYDVQGRVLITQIGSSTSLDISEKTNGIYFLKITTDKGSKVEKLVKE